MSKESATERAARLGFDISKVRELNSNEMAVITRQPYAEDMEMSEPKELTDEDLIVRLCTEVVSVDVQKIAAARLEQRNREIAELRDSIKGKTGFCAGCEEKARRLDEAKALLRRSKNALSRSGWEEGEKDEEVIDSIDDYLDAYELERLLKGE